MIFILDYFERKIVDLLGYGPRDSFFKIKILIPKIFSMDIYIFASKFFENATASANGSVVGTFNITRDYFNVFISKIFHVFIQFYLLLKRLKYA